MISFKGVWENFRDLTKESTSSSFFVLSSQFVDGTTRVNEMLQLMTLLSKGVNGLSTSFTDQSRRCVECSKMYLQIRKKKHELAISKTFIAKG